MLGVKLRGHGEPRYIGRLERVEASGNCWEPGGEGGREKGGGLLAGTQALFLFFFFFFFVFFFLLF